MFTSSSSSRAARLLQSSSALCGRVNRTSPQLAIQKATYLSRAHPRPVPEFPVNEAMQMVLEGIEERKEKRVKKWERNAPKRQAKGLQDDGPYRNQDETVELAINLNLDPRRQGQALRGSLVLPHGTGKTIQCLVLTKDADAVEKAKVAGHEAGGEELLEKLMGGEVSLDTFQRALCTKDILPDVQKKAARLLGPRGLMPNPKTNTVFDEGSVLLAALNEQSNTITFRTESSRTANTV